MKKIACFLMGVAFSLSTFGDDEPGIQNLRSLYEGPSYRSLSNAAQVFLKKKFLGSFETQELIFENGCNMPSPQVDFENVLVNAPARDDDSSNNQDESSIVRAGGDAIVVAFNDYGSNALPDPHFVGYAVSSDLGASFLDYDALPTDQSGRGDGGDPVMGYDENTHTLFMVTLGGSNMETLQLFRSENNGMSFSQPVGIITGYEGTGALQDKPWIAVDPFPGMGQGNVYVIWRRFQGGDGGGIHLVRSTDHGQSWGPRLGTTVASVNFGRNIQGPNVVVAPDHSIHAFWYDARVNPAEIRTSRSMDFGLTFTDETTIGRLNSTDVNGDLGLRSFRSNSFPQAAVNPINGNLYVVYPNLDSNEQNPDIYFSQSSDHGMTWSMPRKMNDDVTTHAQFLPVLSVTPDGARIFVGFYDRRLDSQNQNMDLFGVVGEIDRSEIRWGENFRITSQSFPPLNFIGDYNQATADTQNFYLSWTDTRGMNASGSGNQADIRFAKIPAH